MKGKFEKRSNKDLQREGNLSWWEHHLGKPLLINRIDAEKQEGFHHFFHNLRSVFPRLVFCRDLGATCRIPWRLQEVSGHD